MIAYLIRRLLYAFPILFGVNILTFALFFLVNPPDDMARMQLGYKHVTQEAVEKWKRAHGYHLPLFFNPKEQGIARLTQTIFFQKSLRLFLFDFGHSDSGRDIGADIRQRMGPSLAIAVPTLLLGVLVNTTTALLLVLFRNSWLEWSGVALSVVMMSISTLFYIIAGQFLFAKVMRLVPISGYGEGLSAMKFVILPVVVGVVSGIGSGVRWYRTLFLEEVEKEYVRTARAKGLTEMEVLFRHVLPNGLIPILTGLVAILPLLFMGSLLLESFFGIPGLGNYVIEGIQRQDFAIVRSMVFLGAVLYIVGLILTDLSYTLVDPRVRLE